ncbi:MAG: cytochrome P460 family protein [Gammaproteobacteria bacterium]|nr:cytochrome P460 family protein [Gammaproteobacteria bacterium]
MKNVEPAPNGIEFPADYRDWRVISVSHRTDHESMRAILGNDIAIEAARAGTTNPWPEGAMLGKVVWKQAAEEHWPPAIAPKAFIHVEFMSKDSEKWASTGGWGYSRWVGDALEPYGKDAGFAQECVACHTPVKSQDWVFTVPAQMPVAAH